MLLRRYVSVHAVVCVALLSVLLWTRNLFYWSSPSSYLRMFGGNSCMARYSYSTCRQCHNATVSVANNSGLPSYADTRKCLCYSLLSVSRSLSTLAIVSLYYFCFFEPTVSQALPTHEQKIFSESDRMLEGVWERGSSLVHFVIM